MASDLRKRTIHMLEAMGIPVEYSLPRGRPSQHEIDLRYTDALSMADNVMTVRLVVREIALEQGVYATFMPKPLDGVQGSGMHTHLSLFEGDVNAFHDAGRRATACRRSAAASSPACCATPPRSPPSPTSWSTPTSASIGRAIEAPVYVTWARNNRSALVRVPVTKRGKESSTRIEYRAPDPACNPYLAYSVLLAAGLKGIEEGYELPEPEAAANMFELTPEERAAEGIHAAAPVAVRGPRRHGGLRAGGRGARASTSSSGSCATSAPSGPTTRRQVTQFELERYLPNW